MPSWAERDSESCSGASQAWLQVCFPVRSHMLHSVCVAQTVGAPLRHLTGAPERATMGLPRPREAHMGDEKDKADNAPAVHAVRQQQEAKVTQVGDGNIQVVIQKKDPFDAYGELTGGYNIVQAREWAVQHAQDNLPQRHSFLRSLPPDTCLIWEVLTSRFVEAEDCYEVAVACYPDEAEVQQKAEWTYHVDVRGKPAPGTPVLKARPRWQTPSPAPAARQPPPPPPPTPTLTAVPPRVAAPARTAEDWLKAGNETREAGDHKEAIADYTRAIQLDPKDAAAYNNRGIAYRKLGQPKEAIADYTRAIQLDPKDAAACNNRGYAYQALGMGKEAQADFARAEKLRKAQGG
ncbi:MAG: tetratricopeptide repeat protein [Chloroflexi bacterium]|nr:tetratricopeptide repeat protein [Chloroflexota bacterium]